MTLPASSIHLASSRQPASGTPQAPSNLAKVSQEFEAVFLRQMLAAARKAGFGDSLLGSEAQNTFREMQDSRFADLMAERGTLGFARVIEAGIARQIGQKD